MVNKAPGPHKHHRLTDRAIRAITAAGSYPDGDGLYLVADHKDAKRWNVRLMVQGKRCDLGLGSLKDISLAEARDLAREYRKVARSGGDPRVELRKTNDAPTFEAAARAYYDQHKKRWRNPKHRQQWINTLEHYAFPSIGARRVNEIKTPDIVALLSPIWFEKQETAARVRQRIATVFDDAKGKGHLAGENPVAGVSASLKADKRKRTQHFKAMDYRELPEFIAWLRNTDDPSMTRLALEFTILTAARTGETIGARWTEIDFGKELWTLPANRMKMGEEHRVPLAPRCIEILEHVRPFTVAGDFVFESRRPGHPLSNMAMLTVLWRNEIPATTHGFRSGFCDWCGEQTSFPHAAIEKCMSHKVGNKVEAAYARSDLLDRRREIMSAWAAYLNSAIESAAGTVVPFASTE